MNLQTVSQVEWVDHRSPTQKMLKCCRGILSAKVTHANPVVLRLQCEKGKRFTLYLCHPATPSNHAWQQEPNDGHSHYDDEQTKGGLVKRVVSWGSLSESTRSRIVDITKLEVRSVFLLEGLHMNQNAEKKGSKRIKQQSYKHSSRGNRRRPCMLKNDS